MPACSAAATLRAPAGSTPITRVRGCVACSHVAVPASSPPPPTGTTTTSGACPSCSTISVITVAWPATVRLSSNAGTSVAPVSSANAVAAAEASS